MLTLINGLVVAILVCTVALAVAHVLDAVRSV
jgi:hypothetical protein